MTTKHTTRREFIGAAGAVTIGGPLLLNLPVPANAAAAGILPVRFYGALDSLDPGFNVGGSPDNDVLWCVNPALVHFGYTPDGKLTYRTTDYVESFAERDPTHIDFTLKPGFMWTNGFGELTAEDVKYSYERMATSEWKGFYDAFSHIDVTGTYNWGENPTSLAPGTSSERSQGTITFVQTGPVVQVTGTTHDAPGNRDLTGSGTFVGNVLDISLVPKNGDTDYTATMRFTFSEDDGGDRFQTDFSDTNADHGTTFGLRIE